MASIRIDSFKGLAPAVSPIKLADGSAQVSINARVEATSLVPEKETTAIEALPANTTSFYKWLDQYWLTSEDGEWFVESPVVNDVWKRIYMAGGDYPRYSTFDVAFTGYDQNESIVNNPRIPVNTFRLGVPAPDGLPTVSVTGTAEEGAAELTTAYVYTFVTQYGEEGPPSPPSGFVSYQEGQTRNVTLPSSPTGNYAFGAGSLTRIYRAATGNTGSEFLFVAEVALGTSSYTDDGEDADLGEVLPSTNWYRPLDDDPTWAPDGPLQKIVMMPEGFLAGFAGRVVCFSEQYLPHAWDPNNSLVTESNIVTIQDAVFGLVVLTETRPYIAVGQIPAAMALSKLDVDQSCTSAASAADLGGQVIYASPDGLVSIAGNQAALITDGIITRAQWQEYDPTSIRGVAFENRYYAFYDNGVDQGCLVYDPANAEAPFMEIAFHAQGFHKSAKDDALYLDINDTLHSFGTGANRSVNWKSKKYYMPIDMTFAWGRVVADGDVRIKVYVDSVEIMDTTVTDSEPFRLPAETRGRIIEVEIVEAADRVDSIVLASERSEI
jgi:hypothetical protein